MISQDAGATNIGRGCFELFPSYQVLGGGTVFFELRFGRVFHIRWLELMLLLLKKVMMYPSNFNGFCFQGSCHCKATSMMPSSNGFGTLVTSKLDRVLRTTLGDRTHDVILLP